MPRSFFLSLLAFSVLVTNCTCSSFPEKAEKEAGPSEWFFQQRAYPQGRIPAGAYRRALEQAQALRQGQPAARNAMPWQAVGPYNIGGRVTALAIHPSAPDTIYAGAAYGGIFKTTDNGASWNPVFDGFGGSLSIGALAVAPSDPQTLYVGTGEANAGGGSMAYDGNGVFKTTDGGATWQPSGLATVGSIGNLAIDPDDPNRVFVAAMGDLFGDTPDRGIYRTLDGGANWEKVLFANDSTGGIDVVLHPTLSNIVYAALWQRVRRPNRRDYAGPGSAIYRSTDGGATWSQLGAAEGLPGDSLGRIGLAVTPAAPDVVYAQIALPDNTVQVWKSTNNGLAWTQVDPDGWLENIGASFPWWFGKIIVDPTSPNRVYATGIGLHGSTDGGINWEPVGLFLHADQHALWIDPANPQRWVVGNDGGIYFSVNGGVDFTHATNLPITQFYACELDEQAPDRLFGGAQDNGTNRMVTGNPADWQQIFGGDGFTCLVDPLDSNYVYAEAQYGYIGRSNDGGASFFPIVDDFSPIDRRNWNTPVVFNPLNPAILYYGANRLFKTEDRGDAWSPISPDLTGGQNGSGGVVYGTLTTIAVSPVDTAVIWTGSDDGHVYRSTNSGQSWQPANAGLPDRWITRLAAHPTDPEAAYVTLSGFRWHEYQPHVLRTLDGGLSWTDISGNLPEAPVNDVVIDADQPGTLYVATDVGVYATYDDGATWELLGQELPLVPVLDLRWHAATRRLVAATYGRSMFTLQLPPQAGTVTPARSGLAVRIAPNPMRNDGRIWLDLPRAGRITVEVFELNGKKVASLPDIFLPAGKQQLSLPRTLFAAGGVYLLRVRQNGLNRSVKFVVL